MRLASHNLNTGFRPDMWLEIVPDWSFLWTRDSTYAESCVVVGMVGLKPCVEAKCLKAQAMDW